MPSTPVPAADNAFAQEFLTRFRQQDDPYEALEAELIGPWRVEAVGTDGFGVFRLWEDPGRGDAPRALFGSEATALLAAAVLPGLGRGGGFRLAGEPDPVGLYAIERDGAACGALPVFDEPLVQALNVAAGLARSPEALAQLLRAAGPTAVELAGRRLGREVLGRMPGAR
jgi:hypothetical protein